MLKKVSAVIGIVLGLAGIAGFIIADRNNFAKAGDVLKVRTEIQLMQKEYQTRFNQITKDHRDAQNRAEAYELDKRIWTIKSRYEGKSMDQSTREMLHDLEMKLAELRRQGY